MASPTIHIPIKKSWQKSNYLVTSGELKTIQVFKNIFEEENMSQLLRKK
jgi:hypothetical protein